ncbi:DNA-binding protein [Rhodococcus sp. SGAir0479]|nr:DNA-binding protein [Rhodococcus sp. SGAir0479]
MPKVIDAFRAVVEVILRGSGPAASATTTTQAKALLSADQAAEVLGLGTSTVRAMMASGRLKYVRVGKGRKISPQEIDRFISQHEKFAGEEE